jgi:hypothetical protein
MKKIIFTIAILVLLLPVVHAQTMNDQQVRQILQKAWDDLKTNDSVSFCNFWMLNDSASKLQRRPHTNKDIIEYFDMVREFLDTAINKNTKIDNIDITNENLAGTDTKYWIQAWFKYEIGYYKGFGFYVAWVKNKWVVRDCPSTSTMINNKKKKK